MRLLPRTLFGRTALVIIALVILSQLLSVTLLYFYLIKSPIERAVHTTGIELKTLSKALRLIPASQQALFIRELQQEQNIFIVPDHEAPDGITLNTYLIRHFEQQLRAQLKLPLEIRWQPGVMWIRWQEGGSAIWVGLPRMQKDRELLWPLAGWLLPGVIFGLLGALWIARRINMPLRALSHSATLLGRGETPPDLAETGASEISSLSRVFNQMALDIKRLTSDRTLLLAGVSHDLRTPLSRLRLALEMLGEDADEVLRQGMIQDVDDMDRIVEQFLAYIRDGEIETVRKADLNELVNDVASRYMRQGYPLALELMPMQAFPMRVVAMQRLLGNLIDNALRHGGGEVEVSTHVNDGQIQLSVLDRGPGLPEPQANNQSPSYRVRLGLEVVERIVKLHEGSLQFLPRDGGGLEVRVVFPLLQK